MKKLIIPALLVTSLFSTTFTLNHGWNLLGTNQSVEVSELLTNTAVQNVVIYQNGTYKSSSANEFTTIPANGGFFVYTDSTTTVDLNIVTPPSSVLQHLDGDLNPTTAVTWDILKVVDAGLLVEMKTNTYNAGLTYTYTEAVDYCTNLTVESTSGWRLPTLGELNALTDLYRQGNENHFIIRSSMSTYWSSTVLVGDSRDHYVQNFDGYGSVSRTNEYTVCVKNI